MIYHWPQSLGIKLTLCLCAEGFPVWSLVSMLSAHRGQHLFPLSHFLWAAHLITVIKEHVPFPLWNKVWNIFFLKKSKMVRTFLQAKPVSPLDVSAIMISPRHLFAVCSFFVMKNKVVMELKYTKKSQQPFSVLTNQNAQDAIKTNSEQPPPGSIKLLCGDWSASAAWPLLRAEEINRSPEELTLFICEIIIFWEFHILS